MYSKINVYKKIWDGGSILQKEKQNKKLDT